MSGVAPPMGLVAELTHRCPLSCAYCSNPLALAPAAGELTTAEWCRVFDEAAGLGVLQLHLTGGEPLVRRDIVALVRHAARAGLYTNLITAGVTLDDARMAALVEAGLDHVQLSFQHADAAAAERIGGLPGAQARKLAAAARIRAAGVAFTVNLVVHHANIDAIEPVADLAVELGAGRLEIAHTQYHGWGLRNRAALMPDEADIAAAADAVAAVERRHAGAIRIDHVAPDHHAERPKDCMGGWAARTLVVAPDGQALPCHAAAGIASLAFPSVRTRSLADIWHEDAAFARFRGTGWMAAPCRDCAFREIDHGGCRCQAFALLGDASLTDPACPRSPHHSTIDAARMPVVPRPAPVARPAPARTLQETTA